MLSKFHNDDIMHIKKIYLRAKDIKAMLKYYKEAFGFVLLKEDFNNYYLGPKDGDVLITLIDDPSIETHQTTYGLYHLALLLPSVKDLANFLVHYRKTNYRFVGASDHHVSMALYVEDVEGNGIEVYVDRPSKEWLIKDNEVHMATLPLDLNKLIREANMDDYSGLPKETIIGHLHLHVYSLTNSERFFGELLGFKKTLRYGKDALFLSDASYHHHIGINTWVKDPNPKLPDKNQLLGYTLHVPKDKFNDFLSRLSSEGVNIMNAEDVYYLYDPNGAFIFIEK